MAVTFLVRRSMHTSVLLLKELLLKDNVIDCSFFLMSDNKGPSHDGPEFFITEIDAEFQQRTDEFLNSIRKEHQKINDIVNAFQGKVDKMVDKQRGEYIQAYESHMQDVQRELHTLREKVHEMANNHTKNERTEKLKSEIIQFKRDALQLETDSDRLRSTMTKTVQRIYIIGIENSAQSQFCHRK